MHQFCRQFDNNFDKLWVYKTFCPWLTKYCRGYVPGIPSGVDAYVSSDAVYWRGGAVPIDISGVATGGEFRPKI